MMVHNQVSPIPPQIGNSYVAPIYHKPSLTLYSRPRTNINSTLVDTSFAEFLKPAMKPKRIPEIYEPQIRPLLPSQNITLKTTSNGPDDDQSFVVNADDHQVNFTSPNSSFIMTAAMPITVERQLSTSKVAPVRTAQGVKGNTTVHTFAKQSPVSTSSLYNSQIELFRDDVGSGENASQMRCPISRNIEREHKSRRKHVFSHRNRPRHYKAQQHRKNHPVPPRKREKDEPKRSFCKQSLKSTYHQHEEKYSSSSMYSHSTCSSYSSSSLAESQVVSAKPSTMKSHSVTPRRLKKPVSRSRLRGRVFSSRPIPKRRNMHEPNSAVYRHCDSGSTRSSSSSSTSLRCRGVSACSYFSTHCDRSHDGCSTAGDVDSNFLKAIRSGPHRCPDFILAKHPDFRREQRPSPFQLYYFDGEHPITKAKNRIDAFLHCQKGKEETWEVDGDDYLLEGVHLNLASPSESNLDVSNKNDNSFGYMESYYTESAFTPISVHAVSRALARSKLKKCEKQKELASNGPRTTCCGGRKMSTSSMTEALSTVTYSRPTSHGACNSINNKQSFHQAFGLREAAQKVGRMRNVRAHLSQDSSKSVTALATDCQKNNRAVSLIQQPKIVAETKVPPQVRRYQNFSRKRKTNYVVYTSPTATAHGYETPCKAALEAEDVRRKRNAKLPSVWPLARSSTCHIGAYGDSVGLDQRCHSKGTEPAIANGGEKKRRCEGGGRKEKCRDTLPTSQNCRLAISQRRPRYSLYPNGETRAQAPVRDSKGNRRSRVRRTLTPALPRHQHLTSFNSDRIISCECNKNSVRPKCKGKEYLAKHDGHAMMSGTYSTTKSSGLSCSGMKDTTSLTSVHNFHTNQTLNSLCSHDGTHGEAFFNCNQADTCQTSKRRSGSLVDVGYVPTIHSQGDESDDGCVYNNHKASKKNEKNRNYGYHLRKHFFDAAKLDVPTKGSDMQMLPQYSVSYKNYPTICYDVVVPVSNKDFYRIRKAPGFVMPGISN